MLVTTGGVLVIVSFAVAVGTAVAPGEVEGCWPGVAVMTIISGEVAVAAASVAATTKAVELGSEVGSAGVGFAE